MTSSIPKTGPRSILDSDVRSFLADHPELHLGGTGEFIAERSHHIRVFGFNALDGPKNKPQYIKSSSLQYGVPMEQFQSVFSTLRVAKQKGEPEKLLL